MTTEEQIVEQTLTVELAGIQLVQAQERLARELYEEGSYALGDSPRRAPRFEYPRERLIPLYLEECATLCKASVFDAIEGSEPLVDFKKVRQSAEAKAKALMPKLFGGT